MRLLSFFLLAGAAFAQVDRGTFTGTVSDTSGGLVPNARITIRNTATGAVADVATNEAGQYARPNLPIGPYQITVDADGFKKFVRSELNLGVAETLRVDVQLTVGSTSETVEVSAELPKVNTDSPMVGTSLSTKSLTTLPLSFSGGRTAEAFAYLITPGVSGGTFENHVNGSASFAIETIVDGASTTVNQGGNFSPMSVSVEALQEVKFQTGGMSAEFGRTQSGVFNYVMKSGTNLVHGSLYGGVRNEALNANTFADKARGVSRAQDRKINYAASVGGPVWIPKIYDGRNRTFFFYSHERYRERNYGFGSPSRNAPQPEFYQGDFARLLGPVTTFRDALDRQVARGAIYDPTTFRQLANGRWIGDAFPGNRIPVSRFSQVARNVNSIAVKHYLPTIRDANGQIPLINNQVFPISGNPELDHFQNSVKADHLINSNHKLALSWNYKFAPRLILDAGGLWDTNDIYGGPLAKARRRPDDGGFARLNYDWTVSPRILNNLNYSFNSRGNPEKVLEAEVDGAAALGIKGLSSRGYPAINWGGGPFVSLESPGFMNDSFRADTGFGLSDTVSFSRGRHFFKAGADMRWNQQNRRQSPAGSFTFAARGTAIPTEAFSGTQIGYSFASYLLGIVDSAGWSDPVGLGGRRRYFATFIQDDFKVNSRLTLNLGMRWEYQPPLFEVADRLSSWNPKTVDPRSGLAGGYDFAGSCKECTGRRYFGKRSFKDFGPRLGFAWRATDNWVLRGAYGIMYEGDPPNGYNAVPLGKPTSVAWGGTYRLASDPVTPWAGIFNWDNGFPTNRFDPAGYDVSWGNGTRPGTIDDRYGQTPYIQNWSFNVQRQLPGRFVLDAGYLANKGTRLRVGELSRVNQLPTSALTQYGARLNNQIRNETDARNNGIRYPFPGFAGTVAGALREFPQVQGTQTIQNYGAPLGFSTYHAFQLTMNREFSKGLSLYANYVFSKTMSNVDSSLIGDNDGPLDYYNLGLEKTIAEYDIPHMFKAYASYDLPVGRGKKFLGTAPRAVDAVIGGWSFSTILNYFSGTPMQFSASGAGGGWNGATNRANVAAGALVIGGFDRSKFELSSAQSPNNRYLDRTKFADALPLTLGTGAKRYSQARGFGTINENLVLTKSQPVTEKVRLQLRAEFLNAFNRPQLGGISTSVTNINFGQVTTVSGNRQVQLSVRIEF